MFTVSILLLVVMVLIIVYLVYQNKRLKKQLTFMDQVLELKDTTISNLEASRVAVKDVIENISAHDQVMQLLEEGLSRTEISEKLGIPVNKLELIIKFDKIKREKQS